MNDEREFGIINLKFDLENDEAKKVREVIHEKTKNHYDEAVFTIPYNLKHRLAGFVKNSKDLMRKVNDRYEWDGKNYLEEQAGKEFKNGINTMASIIEYYTNCKTMRDDEVFIEDLKELAKRAEMAFEQMKSAIEMYHESKEG